MTGPAVSDPFDGVVLSYEVGMAKPDPAIYAHALTLLDVPGQHALMVGGSPRDDVQCPESTSRDAFVPGPRGCPACLLVVCVLKDVVCRAVPCLPCRAVVADQRCAYCEYFD